LNSDNAALYSAFVALNSQIVALNRQNLALHSQIVASNGQSVASTTDTGTESSGDHSARRPPIGYPEQPFHPRTPPPGPRSHAISFNALTTAAPTLAALTFDADTLWKVVAVTLYAAVLLVIGYLASKRMTDIRDYFVGGKKLGFINVAFSARATGESAWLLIGLTGMGYAVGVQAFWVVLGELIGVGGAWLFMAKRFKRLTDRYDSVTVPDYLESRLRDPGHWLRLIAAGALLVFVPIYAGTQVFAAGGAFFDFLGINHYLGASIGFAIVLVYITQGGFTAVVWSDVFQGALMFLGLVILPMVALAHAGGLFEITESLRAQDPDLLTLHGPAQAAVEGGPLLGGWNFLSIMSVVGLAGIGIGFWGSPQIFVRFISLKNEKQIVPGAITAIVWTILADSGAVLIGIFGRAMFNTEIGTVENKETVLPFMAETLLHASFTGVYIAMVLSAIMSTIDSLLVIAASAGVRDYWQKVRHPEMSDTQLMALSRVVTVVLALIAFAVGIGLLLHNKDKPIFWVILFGWSGIAATFCPVIMLSLYWSKLTALGAKCAMVTGFLAVPLFTFAAPDLMHRIGWDTGPSILGAIDVLPPSFLIGFATAVVVSILDKPGQARVQGVAEELKDAARR
jgi:sodium/proline symporter